MSSAAFWGGDMALYRNLAALLSGLLFALGLGISGMTDPAKVIAFLDVFQSVGPWDPALMFVMASAVLTYAVGFRLSVRRSAPYFDENWFVPTRQDLTPGLVVGSALFGIGWGLSGFCPGPAITSSVSGNPGVLTFLGSMTGGMLLFRLYESRARPAA